MSDPRYKTLTMTQRRATFDVYVKTKSETERESAPPRTALSGCQVLWLFCLSAQLAVRVADCIVSFHGGSNRAASSITSWWC